MLYKGMVRLVPNTSMGPSLFRTFREAAALGGARYEGPSIGFTISTQGVHELNKALKGYGFVPNVTPQLFKVLESDNPLQDAKVSREWVDVVTEALKNQGIELRDYQKYAVQIMHPRSSYLLLDKPGLGKTLETIAAIPSNAPVLVICPAIAKENVWASELRRFRPKLKVDVRYHYNSFRWPKAGEVVITNYAILPESIHISEYKKWGIKASRSHRLVAERKIDPDTGEEVVIPFTATPPKGIVVIVDEIQVVMNLDTKKARALRAIIQTARKQDNHRCWGLTGTPLDKNPMQLWSLLSIFGLEREAYKSWTNFTDIYGGTRTGYGSKKDKDTGEVKKGYGLRIQWTVPKKTDPPNVRAIEGLRRISIMRKMKDVMAEVPPMSFKDVFVDIDDLTHAQCEKAIASLPPGVSLDEAIDICSKTANGGVPFKEMSIANKMLAIAKVPYLLEYIEPYIQAEEPILVFAMNVDPLMMFKDKPGWGVITGKTSDKERTRLVNDFQGGKLNQLAVSILAAGVALNLDRSAFSFFLNVAYTPVANEQAYLRIQRMTQRRPQLITRFIARHALDTRKMEILDERMMLIEKTTDAASIKGIPKELTDSNIDVVGTGVLVTDARQYHISAQAIRLKADTPRERWIESKLRLMAQYDKDRATKLNDVGWSAVDSQTGRDLAHDLARVGLTKQQWLAAERILGRYSRQIGTFENPK